MMRASSSASTSSSRSGNQIAPVSPASPLFDTETEQLAPEGPGDCVYLDPESPRTRALYVLFAPALRPSDAPLPPPSLKSPSPTEVSSESLSPVCISQCSSARRVSSAASSTQPKFRSPCRRQSDTSFAFKGFRSDDSEPRFFRISSPIPGVPTVITPSGAEPGHYNCECEATPLISCVHPFSVEHSDCDVPMLGSTLTDKMRSLSHPRINENLCDSKDSFRMRNQTEPEWDTRSGRSPRVAWSNE